MNVFSGTPLKCGKLVLLIRLTIVSSLCQHNYICSTMCSCEWKWKNRHSLPIRHIRESVTLSFIFKKTATLSAWSWFREYFSPFSFFIVISKYSSIKNYKNKTDQLWDESQYYKRVSKEKSKKELMKQCMIKSKTMVQYKNINLQSFINIMQLI